MNYDIVCVQNQLGCVILRAESIRAGRKFDAFFFCFVTDVVLESATRRHGTPTIQLFVLLYLCLLAISMSVVCLAQCCPRGDYESVIDVAHGCFYRASCHIHAVWCIFMVLLFVVAWKGISWDVEREGKGDGIKIPRAIFWNDL